MKRRSFLSHSMLAGGWVAAGGGLRPSRASSPAAAAASPMKVGLVTYNLGRNWDLPTVIKNCEEAKFEGVELRSTHAHGVEISLTAAQRADVRKRFADSSVKLVQLGGAYEFHSTDPAEVRKNVEECRLYIRLAQDVGAPGVKVRPNGLQTRAGVPVEKTLEQIGAALRELGKTASDHGVEVRVEVHGSGTSLLANMEKIMAVADHPMVTVNWNSNQTDLEGGTLEENFARVSAKIRHVHMRDLFLEEYPWRRLFGLLQGIKYEGYCCAEIPESADPLRVMRYYRALFRAYQGL